MDGWTDRRLDIQMDGRRDGWKEGIEHSTERIKLRRKYCFESGEDLSEKLVQVLVNISRHFV